MAQKETFELLIEEATPALYDRNAFRILGLSVDTSSREIKRNLEKQKMKMKFSIGVGEDEPIDEETDGGKATADLEQMREAAHRLNDPELRFIDEIFWYWPFKLNGSQHDDAIQAILNDDAELAVHLWKSSINNQTNNSIATHNLAVYYHYAALKSIEEEHSIKGSIEERKHLWEEAFSFWRKLLDLKAFWNRVSERIMDFDDPRLTKGVSRKLKDTLPLALLLVNSRLATACVLEGENRRANMSIYYLSESGFGDSIQLEANKIALEPIRENIKTLTNSTIREAEEDLVHDDKYLLDFVNGETLNRYLVAVDTLLPVGHPTRVGIHDEVAEKISECVMSFSRKTEMWGKAKNIVMDVLKVAASDDQKKHYEELIDRFRENEKSDFTWRIEGYYEINKVLVDRLEEARTSFQLEKFDQAVGILFNLFEAHPELIGRKERLVIYKPLAMCLTVRALARLDKAMELNKTPPPTLAKAVTSYFSPEGLFLYGNCRVCGKRLRGRYYTFQVNGREVELCKQCGRKVKSEMKARQQKTQNLVRQSAKDFLLAEKLDPENETIKEHVNNIRKITKSIETSMPPVPALPGRKGRSVSIPQDKITEKAGEVDKKTPWGSVVVAIMVLGLVIACIVIASIGDTSTEPTDSSYASAKTTVSRATRTPKPTRKPTKEPTYNPYQLPYREGFDSGTRDWYTGKDTSGSITIEKGMYVVSVSKDEGFYGSNGAVFSDATVNLDAYYLSGKDFDNSGLDICFRCTEDRGYELIILGDGLFGVVKGEGNNFSEIVPFGYHKAVHNYWHQPNRIKIIMEYSDFEIYCNGSKVAEFSDSSFRSGSIYLGGLASPTNKVVVGFDNLLVEE